jgi:hypothetical protein
MDDAGPDTPLQRGFFTLRSRRVPVPPPVLPVAPALPDRHGGTAFAVLGREPTVAFATWDLPSEAGEGWKVVISAERTGAAPACFEFPAHAHGAYLHGLEAGGRYTVRARLASPVGAATPFTPPAVELALPPALPVFDAEVRFARVPWAVPSSPSYPAPVTAPLVPMAECADATSPGAGAPPGVGLSTSPGGAPSRPLPSRPVVALPTHLPGPTSPGAP